MDPCEGPPSVRGVCAEVRGFSGGSGIEALGNIWTGHLELLGDGGTQPSDVGGNP